MSLFPYNKFVKQMDMVPKYNFYVSFADLLYRQTFVGSSVIFTPSQILKNFDFVNTSVSVKGITTPGLTASSDEFKIGGTRSNTNIRHTDIDNLQIEFYPENQNYMKHLYYSWLGLAVDYTTNTKTARENYEKSIYVFIHDRVGVLIETRIYFGCYPITVNAEKYDGSQRDSLDDNIMSLVVNNGMSIFVL